MENRLERNIMNLVVSAMDAAAAADEHGAAIVLLQNPAEKIRADGDAVRIAAHDYLVAKDAVSRQRDLVGELVEECRALLVLARDNFKPRFGNSHNAAWAITGLTRSLVISRQGEEVQPLLHSFREVLILHPGEEVASKGITAANFAEFFDRLNAARAELRERIARANDAKDARDALVKALNKRLRDLIKELKMRLDPMDTRWGAFGLNMPGAKLRPETPTQVTVEVIGLNAVAIKWPPVPRAEYYRVWAWVDGENADPIPVGTPRDPDFTFENVHADRLAVSAVNSGGESARSEVVLVVGSDSEGRTTAV